MHCALSSCVCVCVPSLNVPDRVLSMATVCSVNVCNCRFVHSPLSLSLFFRRSIYPQPTHCTSTLECLVCVCLSAREIHADRVEVCSTRPAAAEAEAHSVLHSLSQSVGLSAQNHISSRLHQRHTCNLTCLSFCPQCPASQPVCHYLDSTATCWRRRRRRLTSQSLRLRHVRTRRRR